MSEYKIYSLHMGKAKCAVVWAMALSVESM